MHVKIDKIEINIETLVTIRIQYSVGSIKSKIYNTTVDKIEKKILH
jgi:hypothetical protein